MAAAVSLGLLASCAQQPTRTKTSPELLRAEQLAVEGDRSAAAAIYREQAALAGYPASYDLQLRAVEVLLTPETREEAVSYLKQLPPDGWEGALLVRRRIAEARLALLQDQPDEALALLPESLDTQAPEYAADLAGVRAEAYLRKGMTLQGITLLGERARMPLDEAQRSANNAMIWEALSAASPPDLNTWYLETDDSRIAGWIALARIHREPAESRDVLSERIDAWNQSYPGHPAAPQYTLRVLDEWERRSFRPASIAVLLPMSGRYSAAAAAIMAGTLTAYYDDPDADAAKRTLRFYDTGDMPGKVPEIYEQAVSDGAGAIIGPLGKKAVSTLAGMPGLPVISLSLNYLEPGQPAPANLYQFGLLPEDEARQAAERISIDGLKNTVVFVPAGRLGERLRDSFAARHEELGGTLLAVETYDPSKQDYAGQIQHAFLIDQSRQRHRTLQANLRRDVKFEPRRRQDADSILIVAAPRQARLLNPQFRFHFAGDLPVYATSSVYNGPSDVSEPDLNGIMFPDMPLIISNTEQARVLRDRLSRTNPEELRKYPRLVALGFDAYNFIGSLRWLTDRPYESYPGVTGSLSLQPDRRVYRKLGWARFEAGKPLLMETAPPPAAEGLAADP